MTLASSTYPSCAGQPVLPLAGREPRPYKALSRRADHRRARFRLGRPHSTADYALAPGLISFAGGVLRGVWMQSRTLEAPGRTFPAGFLIKPISKWRKVAENGFKDDVDEELQRKLESRWRILSEMLQYLDEPCREQCFKALAVASLAHKDQKRKCGRDFITHPIEVAKLLAELQMDATVISAGLLHDTVEDNEEITFLDIQEIFGGDVRHLVESTTKASKRIAPGTRQLIQTLAFFQSDVFGEEDEHPKEKALEKEERRVLEQAMNLRCMFTAMAEDYRVILIKLADRLHNMSTLQYMSERSRELISMETLHIYVPIAHRFGIYPFKTELEDLCFKWLFPKEYIEMDQVMTAREWQHKVALQTVKKTLENRLKEIFSEKEDEVQFELQDRIKGRYSIWQKMNTKYDGDLDAVADVLAIRVILDVRRHDDDTKKESEKREEGYCYEVYHQIVDMPCFNNPPLSFKDYIALKKPNGYKSLHCTLSHEQSPLPVEVQIRTRHMHHRAEYGMAAHDTYKQVQPGSRNMANGNAICKTAKTWQAVRSRAVGFLARLRDETRSSSDARQFVQDMMKEELGKRLFVFLRDGHILELSKGCTVLDAAFKIHSTLGLHCMFAKVDNQFVGIDHELENGNELSIMTASWVRPEEHWLDVAYLSSTKAELRKHFKREEVSADGLAMIYTLRDMACVAMLGFLAPMSLMVLSEPFD